MNKHKGIMIIIKTKGENLKIVIKTGKHALNKCPNIAKGCIILIAQTKESLPPGKQPIQYQMEFDRCYEDTKNESLELWGQSWKFIIAGKNCRPLKKSFNISKIQVTDKNYVHGGATGYVEEEDESVLFKRGYLE